MPSPEPRLRWVAICLDRFGWMEGRDRKRKKGCALHFSIIYTELSRNKTKLRTNRTRQQTVHCCDFDCVRQMSEDHSFEPWNVLYADASVRSATVGLAFNTNRRTQTAILKIGASLLVLHLTAAFRRLVINEMTHNSESSDKKDLDYCGSRLSYLHALNMWDVKQWRESFPLVKKLYISWHEMFKVCRCFCATRNYTYDLLICLAKCVFSCASSHWGPVKCLNTAISQKIM